MMATERTKRPHFVPATYLRAWANSDDQIAVLRRGNPKPYITNVKNVAVEAGLYGRDQAGQSREAIFGSLEENWPNLREKLVNRGGELGSEVRAQISLFIALQTIRTREKIAQVEFLNSFAEFSARRPVEKEKVRSFLAERWLRQVPSDSEVEGAWTYAYVSLQKGAPPNKNEVMEMLLGIAVTEIEPRIAKFHWKVEHCRKPMLLTSDRPVMYWRPRGPMDNWEGIGLDDAVEIRMPITPQDLLVIRPVGLDAGIEQVQPRRFDRVNLDVSSQCHEIVIGAESRFSKLEQIKLAPHRPVLRFNMAPGVERMPMVGRSRWVTSCICGYQRAKVKSGRTGPGPAHVFYFS
jgi:hypothetical protein